MSYLSSRAHRTLSLAAFALLACVAAHARALEFPSDVYPELFARVQRERVFSDGKTFADAVPRAQPASILSEYREASVRPGFDLRAFVLQHFAIPTPALTPQPPQRVQDVRAHIDGLWSVLERKPDAAEGEGSTRLPLPQRYVVPGGRFTEIYYWDSYFVMLGLEQSDRHDLTLSMLANFASLIERFGFIPNGTRSYYLSRSQPPFFALMVELAAERDGDVALTTYLPQLRREYAFWMEGADTLARGAAHRRVVRMPDGSLLNRYWDDRAAPRDESYREDVETARAAAPRPAAEVYRELRAAAESGWDFSSRWFADGKTLATIHTTDLVPPDLNSLLYQLELSIARGCALAADGACAEQLRARAAARKRAISQYLWNDALGAFSDYDWRRQKKGQQLTAASLFPLYLRVSTAAQARAVAANVRAKLLQPRGLATTLLSTGQQWDAPNGWAPLQWAAIKGLASYGEAGLAQLIAERWVRANLDVFGSTGKLVEKYDLRGAGGGAGGEYPLQDGFGWTNGVLRMLLTLYPQLAP